jgi:prevent-host-death family protein
LSTHALHPTFIEIEDLSKMVILGHIEGMEKRVKVAELKAQLSAHLRVVRNGQPITICDRETPVARIVPYRATRESLEVRKPTRALADVRLPAPLAGKINSTSVLTELRQSTR